MVTKITIIENCFLINAPAGSGKTTRIENMILNKLGSNRESNILCITYTNRAAEELIRRVDSESVYISTIHSFIYRFIKTYFSHNEILELYFKKFGETIKSRIENLERQDNITELNTRYMDEYGDLSYEIVKENIQNLSYNEMQFSSLYRGALSHDDLLQFTFEVLKNFPKLKKRIAQKYDFIFIDEYQDTSADILRLFYNAVKGEKTQLFLFGDKMQQIYSNYDGTFEVELAQFDTSIKLGTNYRSTKMIVESLNQIYNDPQFKQQPYENNLEGEKPIAYFEAKPEKFLEKFSLEKTNALRLVVFNRIRFDSIGAGELFRAVNSMERYSYGRKYEAVDILTMEMDENPDDVFRELLFWQINNDLFKDEKYGVVIQNLKRKLRGDHNFNVTWHTDKTNLYTRLNKLFTCYENTVDLSIHEWFENIKKSDLLCSKFAKTYINNEEYKDVLCTSLQEFKCLYAHLRSPNISTQHGVKGEGHDEVIFVAEDAKRGLSVYMYDFFKLWANNDIVFSDIQKFYFDFKNEVDAIEMKLQAKLNDFNSAAYKDNETVIYSELQRIYNNFDDNLYFKRIYLDNYEEYLKRRNVTWMKKCINFNKIGRILTAYKLFYVGCSRAKKKLSVLIDIEKVAGFEEELKHKLLSAGFDVKERKV